MAQNIKQAPVMVSSNLTEDLWFFESIFDSHIVKNKILQILLNHFINAQQISGIQQFQPKPQNFSGFQTRNQ